MEYFNELEERVILVGVQVNDNEDTKESLDELEELAQTAGNPEQRGDTPGNLYRKR